MEQNSGSLRRCAIYTRKSSEEGLEQNFNSLDAQREACEAFIASQSGEGWRLLRTAYDDGGLSGGTMERPALRRYVRGGSVVAVPPPDHRGLPARRRRAGVSYSWAESCCASEPDEGRHTAA